MPKWTVALSSTDTAGHRMKGGAKEETTNSCEGRGGLADKFGVMSKRLSPAITAASCIQRPPSSALGPWQRQGRKKLLGESYSANEIP